MQTKMRYHELFLWGLWGFFLLSQTVEANTYEDNAALSDPNQRGFYDGWNKFKCPYPFGKFPDPEDCSQYYLCISGSAIRKRCSYYTHFDVRSKRCQPIHIAVCGNDKTKGSTVTPCASSPSSRTTAFDDNNYVCPSYGGVFPHPTDCSKYYNCFMYKFNLKKCPQKLLFDVIKRKCQPERKVHCGDRQKPGLTTVSIPTETTKNIITSTTKTKKQSTTISTTDSTIQTRQTPTNKDIITETTERTITSTNTDSTIQTAKQTPINTDMTTETTSQSTINSAATETTSQSTINSEATEITSQSAINSAATETTSQSAINSEATETTSQSAVNSAATETTSQSTINSEATETTSQSTINSAATETTSQSTITSLATDSTTQTTKEPSTKTDTTTEVTTEGITTTIRPTGPPEHNCDEDDVDCIITDTGDVGDWFTCPQDFGAYPHPSSDKLFIFCMNWIPSVKKCGLDRYFSKELSTCIHISDFYK